MWLNEHYDEMSKAYSKIANNFRFGEGKVCVRSLIILVFALVAGAPSNLHFICVTFKQFFSIENTKMEKSIYSIVVSSTQQKMVCESKYEGK